MKLTLNWLREFLDTTATIETIESTLSMIGLEVDQITDPAKKLSEFKIVHILETSPHPEADRLQICKVDDGTSILQIVCGAPNARAKLKTVLAPEGSIVPSNGMVIKKSQIRGIESCGMLCSASELGLNESAAAILELADDAPVGENYAQYAGLDDPILDISITPNKGDCLSIYGIARELAAAGIGTLKSMPTQQNPVLSPATINVKIDDSAAQDCPLFMAQVIKNVRNGPSPAWLQNRLQAIGMKPKSILVDVTNYLMMTFGRPMHAFDLDLIEGGVCITKAQSAQTIEALNDQEYTLDSSITVVSDSKKVLSIAGIMGGKSSGCSQNTSNVLLESAIFEAQGIAHTGRKLNINSDSRYRFERGVDSELVGLCLSLATQIILENCGGQAEQAVQLGAKPTQSTVITYQPKNLQQLTGLQLSNEEMLDILTKLGFTVAQNAHSWQVTPPSWRHDCAYEADLIEEIARIYGYDKIETIDLPKNTATFDQAGQKLYQRKLAITKTLAASGYLEAFTWSFVPKDIALMFEGGSEALQLLNPININMSHMRPSLLPNLALAAQRNFDKGYPNSAFFEVGTQFKDTSLKGQQTMVCGVATGEKQLRHWQSKSCDVDIYQAKLAAENVLAACGIITQSLQTSAQAPSYYHPGRSGKLSLGPKNTLAYFGELHPKIIKAMDLKEKIVAFEVFIENIPYSSSKRKGICLHSLQPVHRDFAFIVDQEVTAAQIVSTILKADKTLIQNVNVFDVYQGKGIETGHKSIAVSVTLQPQNATFKEQELNDLSQLIIQTVKNSVGGYIRS